jgi:hypothetical protein
VAGVTLVALPTFAACAVALAAGELAGEGQLPEDSKAARQQQASDLQYACLHIAQHVSSWGQTKQSANPHVNIPPTTAVC